MRITFITLFKDMFTGPFDLSIIKRAQEKKSVHFDFINIRDFGIGKHKVIDDSVYGGGVGMVMRVDVVHKAIMASKKKSRGKKKKIVLMSAAGIPFTQQKAEEYAQLDQLILICGHYEGIDERIMDFIDEEISIGDFVVTGGEIPAMLVADSVVRLLPGVLPTGATEDESFTRDGRILEYPQYTRPPVYKGGVVPEVLLSGNHAKISEWKKIRSLEKTKKNRPDIEK